MSTDKSSQSNLGAEISKMNRQGKVNWISLYQDLAKNGIVSIKPSNLFCRDDKKAVKTPKKKRSKRRSRKRKHLRIKITLPYFSRKNDKSFRAFLKTKGWSIVCSTSFEDPIFKLWENTRLIEGNRQSQDKLLRFNLVHKNFCQCTKMQEIRI